MAMQAPKTTKQTNKNLLSAYDSTAKALGNTRNVCRKYYVHPMLARQYESGKLLEEFDVVDAISENMPFFSPSEQVVLNLIKSHKPVLKTL